MSLPPPPPPFGATPPPPPPFGAAPPSVPLFGAPPQPFPPSSEIRPGTGWYWIAAGVGVVAGILGVVLIVLSALRFVDRIDEFHRVDVPGTETVHLDEGAYTVYAEDVFLGDTDSWSFTGDIEIRDPTERLVELRRYGTRTTYDVSDHEGLALWSFHADQAGNYRVTTAGRPGAIVAIGPGIGVGLFAGIGGGILLIVGGGLFAIITIIVVATKRGRARRRQLAQSLVPYPRERSSSPSVSAMDTALLNAVTWKIPNALALVGSRAGDEWNAMTTSWITQLSMEPVLVGIGVDNTAVTHRLISGGGSFTVNLWSAEDTKTFVKFSKPAVLERAGDGTLTLNGRSVTAAPSGAPVFVEAVAWMDCAVRRTLDLGTHTLFVGEITAAAVNDDGARVAAMSDTRMKYGGVKRH